MLNNQNNNSVRAIRFWGHFFAVMARLGHANGGAISRWDVLYGGGKHTTITKFLSLFKLECGLREFNSRRFHLHWSNP